MCSNDRQGLKALESKLNQAGILSEIRGNPLTAVLGIARFELFVPEEQMPAASELCQGLAGAGDGEGAPGNLRSARGFSVVVEPAQSELRIDATLIPSSTPEPPPDNGSAGGTGTGEAMPESDLARATASLQEEVEALLARELKLMDRCSSLEEKVKGLNETLAHTRADLAREVSNRSSAEKKLAEAGEARTILEKERSALELRLQTSEQALATCQGRLDSQAQQREQLLKARQEELAQRQASLGALNDLRTRVKARLTSKRKPD
jgi:hypothetical protein